ncbi:MAG TPA: efflux RND transporter periplasmic adaptor subunit [Terriglobales bacterium]|nr:efflux RND transporter periplasmic adaptor subunit [Terriglobales bacterium]
MLQRWIAAALALPVLLASLGCEKKEVAAKPSPPEVVVANVVQQDVPIYDEYVAQLNGPVNADITPKVQGYLLRQNYQNGFYVKKGELLFELDPRQYQADVEQAKAQLAVSQANLAKFDADVQRDTPLAAQQAIPQKDLDTDLANQAASRAEVQARKAALENAQLNLQWTKIYSPVDGIAGVANSQVGDLVGTSTKMTTVSQVNPIWAYFNVSENVYLSFAAKVTGVITGKVSRTALNRVPIEFIQANEVPYPQKGVVIYVNRQIGTQTGTIQMAAEFSNPDAVLRPGGYGRVRVRVGEYNKALLVPQPAVIEVQGQYQLIVVTPEKKAMFRPVKVGDRVGPNWVITEGLKPGEQVVVEGIQKVQMAAGMAPQLAKEGIPVAPKPYVVTAGGSN